LQVGIMQAIQAIDAPTELDAKVVRTSEEYVRESEDARRLRLNQNRQNWDIYHLQQDYSHKRPGQSREFLAKQAMAVEQITEFFQQGLTGMDDWWRCDAKPGVDTKQIPISPDEIKKIVDRYLDKLNEGEGFIPFVGDSIKAGLLNSLMICKVHGGLVKKPFYEFSQKLGPSPTGMLNSIGQSLGIVKTPMVPVLKRGFKSVWEPQLEQAMPYEYGVDPGTGKRLYEYHEIYIDWFKAKEMATGDKPVYDLATLELCGKEMNEEWLHKAEHSRETAEPIPFQSRKKILIREFWGTIVDVQSGEVLFENVVWTIANKRHLIQAPTANPFWHGKSPFITSPILRVPKSRWHKALMDAPTKHNIALNEIYNLILDSGMMAAYGLKQYRPDFMEDESSAAEGFAPGQSIAVTADTPIGAKVIERVDSGSMSQESLGVYQLTQQEFNASALTSDLRQGNLPNRMVKATEITEASNSINNIFTGLANVIEVTFVQRILEQLWMNALQNANDLDAPEMCAILGKDRALAIGALSPEERFAKCVDAVAFTVYGVSKTVAKTTDFKKYAALLQTISASPVLMQEFMQQYSMPKLLGQIMSSLDINTVKLEMTPEEQQASQQRFQQAMQLQQKMNAGGNIGNQDGSVNQNAVPQASPGSRPAAPGSGMSH
jgi:hypothetical protein